MIIRCCSQCTAVLAFAAGCFVQGTGCLVLDAWQAHGGLVTPSSMANSGCESYHCTVLVSLQLKDCLPFSVHSSALHCCVLCGLDTLLSAVHSSTMLPGASAAPGPHCERCCHCTRVAPTHSGGKMTELKILEKDNQEGKLQKILEQACKPRSYASLKP